MKIGLIILVIAVLAVTSCNGGSTSSHLKELQRVRAGNLDVVLLSDDGSLTHREDAVTVELDGRRAAIWST